MSEYNINSRYTYLERAKALSAVGAGAFAKEILDVMDKIGVQDFLKEFPVFPASHGLKHRVRRTTNRPASTHRNLYQGVAPNITVTQVIWEPVVQFAQRNEIDVDEFAGMDIADAKAERRVQVEGHMKGLQEDFVYSIFNESRASGSEYIDGIGARLNRLSYPGHTTTTLPYVYNGGGTGADLCSMYVIEWGPRAVHGVMPGSSTKEGKTLGVIYENKGEEPLADTDDSTKTYYGMVDIFKMWVGLACADDWKIVRIANFEADYVASKSFNENLLIDVISHGKFDERATRAYVGPQLYSQLCKRAKDKTQQMLDWDDIFGKKVMTAWGIPIRKLDSTILGSTESAVT